MKHRLTEVLLRRIIRGFLLEKRWADFRAPKGSVIDLRPEDFEEEECLEEPCPPDVRNLDEEIFDLIQTAYAEVEIEPGMYGNAKIRSPADLPGGYTIMQAADLDDDPGPDFFRGGKMRNGRYKLGIVGHDGTDVAINKYLEETARQLKSGAIAEMSGKIAHIMITRHGIPAVTTHEAVESMLGKPVEWIGRHPEDHYADRYGTSYEGFYTREIGGDSHMKILLGGV